MFNGKTTIIVGAGASSEAKLPTGNELKQHIASILDIRFERSVRQISGSTRVFSALEQAVRRDDENEGPGKSGIGLYVSAATRIRDAMPMAISIDNYIDAHQGDKKLELCGKLAIVRSILEAERQSTLYFENEGTNRHPNYPSLEQTWFNRFWQLLTENCRVEQLEERLSSIAFIVFNYDRCIEHFLYHALQTYYGIEADHAASLLRKVEIYHPYGTVGELPWCGESEGPKVDFGGDAEPRQLLDLASQIKTFTEATDPSLSKVDDLRKRLLESHIVLFLGFAFHRQNLRLIKPEGSKHPDSGKVRYFATALGISESDCNRITHDLITLAGARAKLIRINRTLSCCELFDEYWRGLSLDK
jgi:hypothetical protein